MYPVLFSIGSFELHTYGALIALGIMSGLFVTGYLSRQSGVDPSRVSSFCMWLILLGMVGARLLFCAIEWRYYFFHPLEVFKVWKGGMVFYGALLVDVPFAFVFLRESKLPLWKTFDILTPALVIGHAFGRLGCLGAGCCYGNYFLGSPSSLRDPLMRSAIEVFRGDVVRGFLIDNILSTSQFISLLVFVSAAIMLAIRMRSIRTARFLATTFNGYVN